MTKPMDAKRAEFESWISPLANSRREDGSYADDLAEVLWAAWQTGFRNATGADYRDGELDAILAASKRFHPIIAALKAQGEADPVYQCRWTTIDGEPSGEWSSCDKATFDDINEGQSVSARRLRTRTLYTHPAPTVAKAETVATVRVTCELDCSEGCLARMHGVPSECVATERVAETPAPAEPVSVPEGFALVPLKMTDAMGLVYVRHESDSICEMWPDIIAAVPAAGGES